MAAEIKLCTPCKDTEAARQQDAMYGKSYRVHNQTVSIKGDKIVYRCTVCGSLK